MAITKKSHWDAVGSEPGAGLAKYTAGEQPIDDYDNWYNKAVSDDITALDDSLNTHEALTIVGTHGAVSTNTPSKIVIRDANGDFSAGAVTVGSLITAGTVDGVDVSTLPGLVTTHAALTAAHGSSGNVVGQTTLDTHTNNTTTAHGATALATASKIMIRDASGRCAVVAPSVSTDIALKSTVTDDIATHAAVTTTHGASGNVVGQTTLDTHTNNTTTAHGATALATASKIMIRDASGRCAVVAPSASTDIALKSTVTDDIATHAALTVAHGATSANTLSAIVARDVSGNFAAGTITANLTGNASGSSGSCTGNAATASNATSHIALSVAHGSSGNVVGQTTLDAHTNNTTTPHGATGAVVGTTNTQTLTNKRITPRVATITSSATPTPAADTTDHFTVTALAAAATFGAPTGSPTDGQKLTIRVKDNGTARALGWNAIYRGGADVPLPATTVISKTMYLGFIYNSADVKWDIIAFLEL